MDKKLDDLFLLLFLIFHVYVVVVEIFQEMYLHRDQVFVESPKEAEEESDSDFDVHSACSSSPGCGSPVDPSHSPRTWSFSTAQQLSIVEEAREAVPVVETELDKLKTIGEAGVLVEEIPHEMKLPKRLDFQLTPALTDRSYWSILNSHFSYWKNPDVTAFVLNSIYPPSKGDEKAEEA